MGRMLSSSPFSSHTPPGDPPYVAPEGLGSSNVTLGGSRSSGVILKVVGSSKNETLEVLGPPWRWEKVISTGEGMGGKSGERNTPPWTHYVPAARVNLWVKDDQSCSAKAQVGPKFPEPVATTKLESHQQNSRCLGGNVQAC